MKLSLPALFALTALLSACSSYTPPEKRIFEAAEIAAADYGRYPQDYEKIIHQDLEQRLFDYDSAKIKFYLPPKKTFSVTEERDSDFNRIWEARAYYMVCVNVNAKNQYGGYTGYQTTLYRLWNQEMEFFHGGVYSCQEAAHSTGEIYLDNQAPDLVELRN